MENQLPIKINSIQHVGVPVTNIVYSEKYYQQLGFNKVMQKAFIHGGEPGICIMMKNGDIIIELYQMPESQLKEIKARKNGHIDHIAFDVDDIDHTFKVLRDAGLQIDEDEPVLLPFWKQGCKYFNVIGPDGERLEFNQVL